MQQPQQNEQQQLLDLGSPPPQQQPQQLPQTVFDHQQQQLLLVQGPDQLQIQPSSQVIIQQQHQPLVASSSLVDSSGHQLTVLPDGVVHQNIVVADVGQQQPTSVQQDYVVVIPTVQQTISQVIPSIDIRGVQLSQNSQQNIIMSVNKGQTTGAGTISMSNAAIIQQALAQVKANQAQAKLQQQQQQKQQQQLQLQQQKQQQQQLQQQQLKRQQQQQIQQQQLKQQQQQLALNRAAQTANAVRSAQSSVAASSVKTLASTQNLHSPVSPKNPKMTVMNQQSMPQAQMQQGIIYSQGSVQSKQALPNHSGGDAYSRQVTSTMSNAQIQNRQKVFNMQQPQAAAQAKQQQQQQQQLHHQQQHPHQPHHQSLASPSHMLQADKAGHHPHLRSPPHPAAVTSPGPSPSDLPSDYDSSKGEPLAGQTIAVTALECQTLPGQSRKLIKLVVSGAKGQAHNLLSKNTQLQGQILNMMQKAKTSKAEVSFPAEPDQPIKISCKASSETKMSAPDSNQKHPMVNQAQGADMRTPPHMNNPAAHRKMTPAQTLSSASQQQGLTIRNQGPGQGMTPNVPARMRPQFAPGNQPLISPQGRQFSPNIRPTGPQTLAMARNQLTPEKANRMPAGVGKSMAGHTPRPVALAQQSAPRGPQQQVYRNQQTLLAQSATNDGQSANAAKAGMTVGVLDGQSMGKQQGIRVISSAGKDGSGDAMKKDGLISGNEYLIECPNGKRLVALWDGNYFKVKNKGSNDGSQVASDVPSAGGESTGAGDHAMHMDDQMVTSTSVKSEPVKAPTPPVKKRAPLPKQEGKYAVCDNCGNLSEDYEICEGCHRPLPEVPKFFNQQVAPNQMTPTSGANNINCSPEKSASANLKAKTFYGNKASDQLLLQQKALAGRGAAVSKAPILKAVNKAARGRARGKKLLNEPETVTILSSEEEEDEETLGPVPKQPRLESATPQGVMQEGKISRRARMEDGSGRVRMRKPGITATSVSASKTTEQKQGTGTVIKLVDPVLKLCSQLVRIGSMQTQPLKNVEFSLKGFLMMLKLPTSGATKIIDVRIDQRDIREMQVSFNKVLVMFVRVTQHCAHRIRHRIGPCQNNIVYFDPDGSLEGLKFVTIILKDWQPRDQEIFKAISRKLEIDNACAQPKVLYPMLPDKANDLLVQTSIAGTQKSRTLPGTQIISQTTSGLVSSQVVLNQGVLTQVLQMPSTSPGSHLILTLPGAPGQMPKLKSTNNLNGDEEEEEPMDRSRSPSPLLPSFSGPVVKLFTYPPRPSTGGICVTNEDLFCLNEGEFLNDVIIDFYLKYLFNEMFNDDDKVRTHVFSSFFYRRLTQKQTKRFSSDEPNLSAQEKRHSRVKTWTRHVDLFEKDFIIVPINESAHWYLAIICFPGLLKPLISGSPPPGTNPEGAEEPEDSQEAEGEKPSETEQKTEEEQTTSPTQESGNSQDGAVPGNSASTEEGKNAKAADATGNAGGKNSAKRNLNIRQPCILIFDSLYGPSRSSVVRTLREYLQVEWNVKKSPTAGERVLTKENMKGAFPKCPQQTNFSDCGVFVLQYVESFFKNPIRSFNIPMPSLQNWFSEDCVKQKREELRLLILDLQQELNPELDYDPAQDGCLGVSPATMVTIPLNMEGGSVPVTPVMAAAGVMTEPEPSPSTMQPGEITPQTMDVNPADQSPESEEQASEASQASTECTQGVAYDGAQPIQQGQPCLEEPTGDEQAALESSDVPHEVKEEMREVSNVALSQGSEEQYDDACETEVAQLSHDAVPMDTSQEPSSQNFVGESPACDQNSADTDAPTPVQETALAEADSTHSPTDNGQPPS